MHSIEECLECSKALWCLLIHQSEMLDVRCDVNLYTQFAVPIKMLSPSRTPPLAWEIGNAEAAFWQNSLNLTLSLFIA